MAKAAKVTTVTPISASFADLFPKGKGKIAQAKVHTRGKMFQSANKDVHAIVTYKLAPGAIQVTDSGKFLVNLGFDLSAGPIEFVGPVVYKDGKTYNVTVVRDSGYNVALTCSGKSFEEVKE